jgi:glycosyltransferase A (GT-A) superfamily protein (DUF2064 family)
MSRANDIAVANELERLRDALNLVLMFHSGGEWTTADRAQWKHVTGSDEATTKVLCDHIRKVMQ